MNLVRHTMLFVYKKQTRELMRSMNFILQTMLLFSLPLVDSAVLSFIGTDQAIAGSSIGIILGLTFTLIYSSVFGASSYLSQSYELNRDIFIKYYAAILLFSFILVILITISYSINNQYFDAFTGMPSVDSSLSDYLKYFIPLAMLYWVGCLLDLLLYNTGHDSICLKLTLIEIPINIALSIYLGLFMNYDSISGVAGVAIASLVAKAVKIMFCLIFIVTKKSTFNLNKINFNREAFFNVSKKTIPYIMTGSMWSLYGYVSYKLILNLNYDDMFVFSLIIPWVNFCFTTPSGFANYLSISLAKKISNDSITIDYILELMAPFFMLVTFVIAVVSISFYMIYRDRVDMGILDMSVLFFALAFTLIKSFNIFASNGILKSGLDNYFVFFTDLVVMWFICFPILILTSKTPLFGLLCVFVIYFIEELMKLIIYWRRVFSLKWIVKLLEAV